MEKNEGFELVKEYIFRKSIKLPQILKDFIFTRFTKKFFYGVS